jgi:hypothetical protein
MQDKSSAKARIQRNHQITSRYRYDTEKIQTIFCHCKHTVKNTQLFTIGARIWVNLNLEYCYDMGRGTVIV